MPERSAKRAGRRHGEVPFGDWATVSRHTALEARLLLSADVLTYHNDNARDGANLSETQLTPSNVNFASFGKLGQVQVDGAVYTQPLVKTNVPVPGRGTQNLVFVATEHDSVYAFNADSLAPVWHDSFINPQAGVTTVSSDDVLSTDVGPEIGITGTPVIDPSTRTLYVVTKTKTTMATGVTFDQKLHALDLATGAEKFGGPVSIRATVPGNGDGGVNGQVSFDPLKENQRPALLLSNGNVYTAFASYGDNLPFHGWVLGYNARTLKQSFVFNATPNGGGAGIWMSGGGISADASGNLFLATGNGSFDSTDFGDTVLKLHPGARSVVADTFTPSNQQFLQDHDLDLGSAGVILLPDQPGPFRHLLVTGDKSGKLYVLNRDSFGGFSATTDRAVQEIPNAFGGLFSSPAFFNGTIYAAGAGVVAGDPDGDSTVNSLSAYTLSSGALKLSPAGGTAPYGYPGATPSISANGTSNGIVWTVNGSTTGGTRTAVLRAYSASNINQELYNSTQVAPRDTGPRYVKFSVPTVANGKVYVAGNGALALYGSLVPQASRMPRRGVALHARHAVRA